jgi:HlyD family type I secretion membrane fusion protein
MAKNQLPMGSTRSSQALTVAEKQTFLRRTALTPVVFMGVLIVTLFFGCVGSWLYLAPLSSAAIAPAVLVVNSSRKVIKHLEGGIVSEILVGEGSRVRKGQVLLRLDDTHARATMQQLRGAYWAASALERRLIAERDGLRIVKFPDWMVADCSDPRCAKVMTAQHNIFAARKKSFAGRATILDQQIGQLEAEIAGLGQKMEAEERQRRLIREEIADVRQLHKKGLVRKPRLSALRRREAEIDGAMAGDRANVARLRQRIAETAIRKSELETARVNEAVVELREAQSQIFDLEERMRGAKEILGRIAVRAPDEGTVVELRVHTKGGVIAPGEQLLDLIPSKDSLLAEARIAPRDIDSVHPNLMAEVRLTALPQRNAKPLMGKLVSVSADRLIDQRTGESYYLGRIELSKTAAQDAPLYPGMQAEVIIETGAWTPFEYLIKPVLQSFNRAMRES